MYRLPRNQSIDLARGLAIGLMILSHTTMGLNTYATLPSYGLVPVHLITKFSSTLFFLVFGISLGLFFLPQVKTPRWPEKRADLFFRALEVLLWYKVLTVVQMFQTYPKKLILDTLMFNRFPDFVEVLGFYAFALLWIPLILPTWSRIPLIAKPFIIAAMAYMGHYLNTNIDWGTHTSIQAILVEKKGYFTFGQFQRGATALLGITLGEIYHRWWKDQNGHIKFGTLALALGSCSLVYFASLAGDDLSKYLLAISKNYGKHPPTHVFMSYSMGGALCILGTCVLTKNWLPRVLAPFTQIGTRSLFSFCFHIFVIFVIYRYFFGLRLKVSYGETMMLAIGLILTTAGFSYMLNRMEGKE